MGRKHIIIHFILCILLSGCFFRPCSTTLKIINEETDIIIILTDINETSTEYLIKNNEIKYFDKYVMNNIYYIHIKNDFIEKTFKLREYDHWFSRNHNIKIIIRKNDGKKIID